MTFEELIEYLGIDEPEIIDYNSGAELGGLTEEQRKYILSEFINGRPVYIMILDSDSEVICSDTTLGTGPFTAFLSATASQILGSDVNIMLAGSDSSIDDGGSSYA